MPHRLTRRYAPDQLTVIESLVAGKSITAAAKQAGIRRETVHRWMREDYEFQAALHRLRRELLESVGAQVLATSRRAAETVDKAVAGGDVKTALQVLRGTGMLSGDRARCPRGLVQMSGATVARVP